MAEASDEPVDRLAFAKAWLLKRPLAVLIATVTLGVFLFAVKRTFDQVWNPVFDNAGIWIRTWDVGTRHTPLVGPSSRFGWHHPGPLLFYSLAPLLRLFSGLPSALLVGVFLAGLASLISAVVLAARTAGTSAALVVALGAAIVALNHGDRLIDPWNPHVVVLPFALFLVAAWLACSGDAVAAPVAVVAGTFAAQSHLGAVPPVAIIGASAVALGLVFRLRLPQRAGGWRWWAFALALTLVLWAPPSIEQASANGGNITRLFRFFLEPASGPALGWKKGLLMAGYELLPWGPWIGRERATFFGELATGEWWEFVLSCSPLAIALVLAMRFRDALGVRLVAIGAAAVAACVVANAQTRGMPLDYLTLWSKSIAMLIVAAPLIVLARKYATPVRVPWFASGVAQVASVAIVSLTISTRAILAEVPLHQFSRLYQRIVRVANEAFPLGSTVRIAPVGPPFTASAEAIVVGLERAGRSGKMLEHYAFEVGEHRAISNQAVVPTLMLVFSAASGDRPKPGIGRVVDQQDPLPVHERKEATMLREKLETSLRAGGRGDLVQPLRDGAVWVWLNMPPTVNANELGRYLSLASGTDKLPWVLYALPPAAW